MKYSPYNHHHELLPQHPPPEKENMHLHINNYRYRLQSHSNKRLSLPHQKSFKQPFHTPTKSISTRIPPITQDSVLKYQLQSDILELQKTLNNQKFQMSTLTEEIDFYEKLCRSNKEQLKNHENNKKMLINEYQQQIQIAIAQRNHTAEIVAIITKELEQQTQQQQSLIYQKKSKSSKNNQYIEILLDNKQTKLNQIKELDESTKYLQSNIQMQEEKLYELRNIERKFQVAIKQLQRMRKSKQ